MLFNYLKIAIRSLLKFKGYAAINLFGLALGLTAGILIMIYVVDEISYDNFHAKGDRIYRVGTNFKTISSGSEGFNETNGWPVGDVLRKEYPEVEAVAYARAASFLLINYEGKRIREQTHFVSPEFFNMFSFPLVEGNSATALQEPYSIVISEKMADKYFRGTSPLNKTILMADTINMLVTGVFKNIPSNSHIQSDIFVSFATYETMEKSFNYSDGWGNINVRNYLLLKEGVDFESFRAKAKNIYMEKANAMLKDWGVEALVSFEPLEDVYLKSKRGNGMGPLGSIDRVYLVAGIAVFVIILACINFINLTTARSVYRSKEVGLRKVVGSTRAALIRQFLSESFVLTVFALIIAVALTSTLLPFFNELLAKTYDLGSLFSFSTLSGTVALVLIVTLLAGYYPAVVMSALKPAEVLKGKLQHSDKGVQLRRALVVFQFVISVGLVLGTFIVIDQLKYMQQQDLGFAKDEIFVVNAARVNSDNPKAFETFKQELKQLAIVEEVSYTNALPGSPGWNGQVAYPEGNAGVDAVSVEYMAIDDHYISALGLDIIAGRGFDQDHEADLKEGLILNETAVSRFGWSSPAEAIGKKITSPSGYPAGEVIGVIKDYHRTGLQQNIGPLTMDYNPSASYLYAIRYKAANTQQLITSINGLWQKTFPGFDFNYFFLNESFEKQYQAEQRLATVFGFFSAATIIIAVIGLLGLVSFMVAARTKEIGVRKVLGANLFHITKLLSKEFIVLVIVANIIACPIAWYAADQWLQHFANRVQISPMLFVVTLLIALMITLISIGYQTVKAALTDPVKSLRYE